MPPADPPSSRDPRDPSLPPPSSPDQPHPSDSVLPPSLVKSLPAPPPPDSPGPRSRASLVDDDELVADKKRLVAALDKIVEPLDQILGLMRNAWRGGVILLVFSALMVAVQVHTTLRMVSVQEQLAEVVAAQKTLQQTATTVADKQTATQNVLDQQSQITIEPSMGPDGAPTAIVVVKPPPASSTLPAIPLPLAPTVVSLPPLSPKKRPHAASSVDGAAPAPPPPAPAPIHFE